MICPYLWTTVENVVQRPFRYSPLDVENIDGTEDRLHMTCNDATTTTKRYFEECAKENCACFYDGKCQRR